MPYFVPADVVEGADGSLVCKTHGNVICSMCNVNYTSFTWVNGPLKGGEVGTSGSKSYVWDRHSNPLRPVSRLPKAFFSPPNSNIRSR